MSVASVRWVGWLGLGLAVAACAPREPTMPMTPTMPTEPTCPVWGCGMNAATVGDGIIFDELDRTGGEDNTGGVRIVEVLAHGDKPATLGVDRQKLFVVEHDSQRRLEGADLIGTVIKLLHAPSNELFELQIADVLPQHLWFWAPPDEYVEAYDIKSRRTALGQHDFKETICKGDILGEDPGWGRAPHAAIVFEWDRYDAAAKTVRETGDGDPWFNLACAGTAKAKMHLLRHTLAGSYDNRGDQIVQTDVPGRQAMLKMLTADYCGTGQSFTRDGTPLLYGDKLGIYPPPQIPARRVEAHWDADGAVCLNTPRIYKRNEVLLACGHLIPTCDKFNPWTRRAYAISGLPTP